MIRPTGPRPPTGRPARPGGWWRRDRANRRSREAGRDAATAAERRVIDRTWRTIAVQTALVFAVALGALDAVAVGLILYTGHADARRQLTTALADPDALTRPPAGIWVYRYRPGVLRHSPGSPAEPPAPTDLTAAAADGRARGPHDVRVGDRELLVRTERQGQDTVQIALDLSAQDDERHRMYLSLAGAGIAGLLVAAGVGALVARRAIAPLGQAVARQRRFVADASHELRTPLTQLSTRAQLLRRELAGPADPDRLAADAEQLVRGTRHMADVVEELLLAAQLRSEPAGFGPVDLGTVALDALEAERPRAEQRAITLELRAEPDTRYLVRGAATTLRRVLTALLDNALGHTPAGGRVVVALAYGPDRGLVRCSVADTGVGIDPADAERLFERFARGRHGDGRRFGLGLALVREAVEAHGGRVVADGRPGQGATFSIELPSYDGPPATAQ